MPAWVWRDVRFYYYYYYHFCLAFALHRNQQKLHCRAHACTLGAGWHFRTVSDTENEEEAQRHPGTKTIINPAEDNCKK